MAAKSPCSPELRRRAVRMVGEARSEYPTELAAITAVAEKLGISTAETLRTWVFRAKAEAGIDEALRTGAHSLDLSRLRLASLPDSLGGLTALTSLNLSGNRLRVLPESLGRLKNLTSLNLRGNRLRVLPESLGNLTDLTSLYVDGNQLTMLPESFGHLTDLTALALFGNHLSVLPESFGNLTKLTWLQLNNEPISSSAGAAAGHGLIAG